MPSATHLLRLGPPALHAGQQAGAGGARQPVAGPVGVHSPPANAIGTALLHAPALPTHHLPRGARTHAAAPPSSVTPCDPVPPFCTCNAACACKCLELRGEGAAANRGTAARHVTCARARRCCVYAFRHHSDHTWTARPPAGGVGLTRQSETGTSKASGSLAAACGCYSRFSRSVSPPR